MVCIRKCYTDESIEVSALNVTMPGNVLFRCQILSPEQENGMFTKSDRDFVHGCIVYISGYIDTANFHTHTSDNGLTVIPMASSMFFFLRYRSAVPRSILALASRRAS